MEYLAEATWVLCTCLFLGVVPPSPSHNPILPAVPVLAPVSEKVGLVCLDDDHIEELAPIRTYHVPHTFVPVWRWHWL